MYDLPSVLIVFHWAVGVSLTGAFIVWLIYVVSEAAPRDDDPLAFLEVLLIKRQGKTYINKNCKVCKKEQGK